jgi:hypothetical protein
MEEDSKSTFQMRISILNNEILSFSVDVDDFKTKWIILGLIAFGGIMGIVATFGPTIKTLFVT